MMHTCAAAAWHHESTQLPVPPAGSPLIPQQAASPQLSPEGTPGPSMAPTLGTTLLPQSSLQLQGWDLANLHIISDLPAHSAPDVRRLHVGRRGTVSCAADLQT